MPARPRLSDKQEQYFAFFFPSVCCLRVCQSACLSISVYRFGCYIPAGNDLRRDLLNWCWDDDSCELSVLKMFRSIPLKIKHNLQLGDTLSFQPFGEIWLHTDKSGDKAMIYFAWSNRENCEKSHRKRKLLTCSTLLSFTAPILYYSSWSLFQFGRFRQLQKAYLENFNANRYFIFFKFSIRSTPFWVFK